MNSNNFKLEDVRDYLCSSLNTDKNNIKILNVTTQSKSDWVYISYCLNDTISKTFNCPICESIQVKISVFNI